MFRMVVLILLLASYHVIPISADTGHNTCCHHTQLGECKKVCRELYKEYSQFNHTSRRKLTSIVNKCPQPETAFWKCLHSSDLLHDFRKETKSHNSKRYHSNCCKEAKHTACEVDCLTTKNISKLLQKESCDANREPNFTKCIKKVHDAKKCCASSKRHKNKKCRHACMQYFKNVRSESVLEKKNELEIQCGLESKQYKCAISESKYDTAMKDHIGCCNEAHSMECRQSCMRLFKNPNNISAAFQGLSAPCGTVDFDTPLFKCLVRVAAMKSEERKLYPSGRSFSSMISKNPTYKMECCPRAKSESCRKWCDDILNGVNKNLDLRGTMYLSCIEDPREIELYNCFNDIMEPCEIGLKEPMKFCSNFNHRSMDLYRHGDSFGDDSAKRLHKLFSDGIVNVLGYKLVFKDVSTCRPEQFKAMACLLTVKPCNHRYPQKQICRSDCESLLADCLDHERSQSRKPYTVEKICTSISPNNNQSNCIPFKYYTQQPSQEIDMNEIIERREVTLPCRNDPCAEDEVCVINHECTDEEIYPCKKYKCLKGCPVTQRGNLIIPVGQLAKLSPVNSNGECYQVCKCQSLNSRSQAHPQHVQLGSCKRFGCNKKANCTVGKVLYRDGEIFRNRCNTCTCTDGTLDCTNRNCDFVETSRPRRHHDSKGSAVSNSPCSCHNVYNPVCAMNGMTYPNACLAKCGNIVDADLNLGDCQEVNPCDPDSCTEGHFCIPNRYVCLSPWSDCPQFKCLPHKISYRYQFLPAPTCNKGKNMRTDEVCGFDGVTYINECKAEESGTGVDYYGPCLPKNLQKGDIDRCKSVQCTPMENLVCDLTIPPGSCCPKCGSTLRFLYSKKDVENHKSFISSDPVAVIQIVKNMRQLLKVVECKIYGHLTVENDLLILVMVNSNKPTRHQVFACKTEAERLHKYVLTRSPVVQTNYYLSFLKASKLKTAYLQKGKSSASTTLHSSFKDISVVLFCSLLTLLLTVLYR